MTRISGEWLSRPATQRVMAALTDAGAQAFFVGGCVRNALLGCAVNDVDIATDALPDRVIEIATAAGLKAIPTGYDHGTITVISQQVSYEVTTFRQDVETDGRHAVVSFSDQILDDARRRDFTINALYADAGGLVYDPLGGLDDVANGRVRFIEDPNQRIAEDHLRSLRFFRFFAWYGGGDQGLDAAGLAAIAQNLDGLDSLSRERVGSEVYKLLGAPNPAPAVAAMRHCGVLGRVLPGADDRALAPLVHLEGTTLPNPIRRLAALGGQDVGERLRLSRGDTRRLDLLRQETGKTETAKVLGYRHGVDTAFDVALLRAAMLGGTVPVDFQSDAALGAAMEFPLTASDFMPALQGPALGQKLREREDAWIHSDLELTRSQLLS
jgi:poly(A) polymerase